MDPLGFRAAGRLAGFLSSKWLSKMLHLYEEEQPGRLKAVLPEPETALSASDIHSMKQIPGVYEAYEGLGKLPLDVLAPEHGLHLFLMFLTDNWRSFLFWLDG